MTFRKKKPSPLWCPEGVQPHGGVKTTTLQAPSTMLGCNVSANGADGSLGFGEQYPGIINPLDNRVKMVPEKSALFQYFPQEATWTDSNEWNRAPTPSSFSNPTK